MPNWTKNQYDAINSTNGSVLVSASAGSGKTAVLVERVIKRLTNEVNPTPADRMLIVTYTKAAAAEMKDRVIGRISELIKENPHDTYLRRQQLKLQKAHISTIHSFCSEIVRDNFYILNVSKDFRIADDGELSLLKNEAIDSVFNDLYEKEHNEDFLHLVEAFSGNKDDSNLKKVVFKLYDFLLSHPFPENWLKEKLSYYDTPNSIGETVWADIIFEYTKDALDFAKSIVSLNRSVIEGDSVLKEKLLPVLESDITWINHLEKIIETRSWDLTRNTLNSFSPVRLPTIKDYKYNPDKLRFAANRDEYKNIIKELKNYFLANEEECKIDILLLQPVVKEMFHLVLMFKDKFRSIKGENNVLDFSDLEHLTLKLLVKNENGTITLTEQAKKIASSFDEVMVDEYQDANEVQDIIFKALSGNEKNLFVVGDVKQSIYSFRQAMPEIFIKRKNSYSFYDSEKDNYPGRIILEKNFRSRKEITDSINFIFKALMSEKCGEIEYNTEENLVCGADYNSVKETKVSLSFIDMDIKIEDDICKAEAEYIAREIYRIIGERKVKDKQDYRQPYFGDFAILLRSANKYAPIYVNKLKEFGIPATTSVSDNFLSTREIMIILNLLRIIDNPLQDIPLLSVMMSPLYGFTPDDLAKMRSDHRHSNMFTSLKKYSESGNTKAISLINDIDNFRTYSVTNPVHLLINKIYEVTSYPAIIKGMYSSNLPYNNILLFKEYAKEYEEKGYKGLSSFINYIDKLIKHGSDLQASSDTGAVNTNTVKVMSIHSSKGLEFPFVFLANTSRKFVTDSTQNVLLHKELGFSLKRRDTNTSAIYNTLAREATAMKMQKSEKSEELRILYVALTRAREELHMVCAKKNMRSYIEKTGSKVTSSNAISPFIVASSNKLSDWLLMCGLINKNGSELRKIAGVDNFSKYMDCPHWDIKYIFEDDLDNHQCETAEEKPKIIISDETDDIIDNIIDKRLEFVYGDKDINLLPVKVAVSEISHNKSRERFSKILSRPDFMSEKSMTATERGTAVHNTLQHIDFKAATVNLEKELERLVKMGYISENQYKVIDSVMLKKLLASDIINDVINSKKVYREFKFNTKIKASRALENIPETIGDKDIILQGSVDLAYLKDGKIYIVDYKTDRVNSVKELKDLYSDQLLLYREAMEQCTPYKVSKCIIYSIRLGEFIEV